MRRGTGRPPAAAAAVGLALGAGLLLAACGSSGGAATPNWKPQPSFSGEAHLPNIEPALPTPGPPGSESGNGDGSGGPPAPQPSGGSSTPGPSGSGSSAQDPNVVATHLNAPTGIVVLPDQTALVGERTTGRVLRVQPKPGQPVTTVRTIGGLDTAHGGGLLDLALSPTYPEDNLIYAYITTPKDNRVVTFTLTGTATPVLVGIPRGNTDNAGRIAFDRQGRLYVATGDAGKPANATNPDSLAGKVLRVTDIGRPAPGNPRPDSAVYASGLAHPAGLCTTVPDGTGQQGSTPQAGGVLPVLEIESGGAGVVRQVRPNSTPTLSTLPGGYASPGGCAVFDNALYVTSLDGQELLRSELTTDGGTVAAGDWKPVFGDRRYGRLLTATAGSDGSLWLATSNKDGHGTPVPDDERIIRIMADGGGGDASPL